MPTPANQVEALECPLRNHWVSFRLVDEHGQGLPYAGLAYRLQDKEGQSHTGTLDRNGYARVVNLCGGVSVLDLSTPYTSSPDSWHDVLANRETFNVPLSALQVAAEQSPFGPRHNGQTYLAKERAVAEGAKFFRVEVSDFVEAAAHLPDPDSGWAPRPPKLKNATDQQQLGVDLEPNRHHVLEVKALRAYRPLLSRDKAFCALNAYHLAVMSTFVYAPFSKEAPFGTPYQSAPPPYKEPGSIGHVLREGLSCGKRPTQFNTAGPYHLLYEEVPYSKRLEVMPYDPSRYRDEALRGWNNPEDVHFLYHEDSGTQGFITHSDRVILISIRGTQGLKDILTDLDGRQEPFSGGVGQAHRGFHGGFKAAQAFVQRYLDAFYHPDHSIMVCGHSLGGAIALLLAEWLRREPKQPQVQLYTFGAPRAGDRTFVQGAQELIHHRLVNHNDLIPGVPTPWLDAEWKLLMAGTATLHLSPLGGVTLLLAGLLNLKGDPYEHHGEQRHFMPRKKDAKSEASILWQPGCEALESLTCAQYAGLLDLQGDMPQRGQPSLAEHSSDTGYSRAALTTLLRWTASLERDGELFSREEADDLAEQVKALESALADWRPGSYLQFRRAVRLRHDRRFYNKSEEELRRIYDQGVLLASQLAHSQRQQLTRTLLRLQTQGQRLITPQAVFGEFAQRPDLPELVSQWRAAKENRHAERLARLPVPQERAYG